jgi:hypothetical protein
MTSAAQQLQLQELGLELHTAEHEIVESGPATLLPGKAVSHTSGFVPVALSNVARYNKLLQVGILPRFSIAWSYQT